MITKILIGLDDGSFLERPVEQDGNHAFVITDKNGTRLRLDEDFTFTELSYPVRMGHMIASIQPRNEKTGIPAEASITLSLDKCRDANNEIIGDIIDMATLREIQQGDGLADTPNLELHVYGDVSDEEETDIIDITEENIRDALSCNRDAALS